MTDPLFGDGSAARLVAALVERGQTIATAESLTAGLLAATIASVPGASAVLRGGLIVYATDLKGSLGGVDADTLAADGPVAASTARSLAIGAVTRCTADWGVALTGVAGPDAQDGKPVGTVFLGVCAPDGTADAARLQLAGSRWDIRSGAAVAAITEMLRRLAGNQTGVADR